MPDEYRVGQLERRVEKLEQRTEDIGVLRNEITNLWRAVNGLSKELATLDSKIEDHTRALYTAALSVAGGAILVAITLFRAFG